MRYNNNTLYISRRNKNMTVPERLSALRKCMEEKNIDVYVVPTADFHQSEYVGEHFKARKFITGFSGSAGTAVITKTEARLWTDGRYFIQAAAQLKGTTVELMKMGEPGVPEMNAYIEEVLKEGETLGFDGRVVSVGEGEGYAAIAGKKNAKVNYQVDLIDEKKLDDKLKAKLAKDGVNLHPYNDIYEDVKKFGSDVVAMIDPGKLNYALFNNIPENVKTVEKRNPAILMKAIKNPVEIENIRKAQIKDSVAHVRFMKWLKENVGKMRITEMSASDKLDEFRAEMGKFIRPSFEPISSFGEHGAIVHYTSSPETDVELKEGQLFLTDTGAGFYEGSTDVTRTYALGEVPQIMKDHFTLVAISNLQLGSAKFLEGSTGMILDILARKPFWDRDLNFNHGTGHGVGYLLNIHEGPAGFRWKYRKGETEVLQEGMVITDEPGIYIEGSHGIRLENELLTCKGTLNEYGQFMYFEAITLIPMDLDAINPDIMTQEDKKLLNDYHAKVYEVIAPYLNEEEQEWLKKYTRAI